MLRNGLTELLQEFRDSLTGRQLLDREEANGRCKPASLALLGLMHERGVTDAALLNFQRPGEEHYVVELDGMIIDPSARQFAQGATADVPSVLSYNEFASDWDPGPLRVDFTDAWARPHPQGLGQAA